jgi:hypothetical protein
MQPAYRQVLTAMSGGGRTDNVTLHRLVLTEKLEGQSDLLRRHGKSLGGGSALFSALVGAVSHQSTGLQLSMLEYAPGSLAH